MSIKLKHAYPLKRWCTVWTLFIKKELGNLDIDQLHCIMIFEANWQLLLKYHSSYRFLPKTKAAGTLVHAQGRGWKGHSTINQATQQIVKTKITHLPQKQALDLYLDLCMCFALMVKACHNLACQRHGAEDAYLCLHAHTHQLMHYYVRHKFGNSLEFNTFSQHPWHGAGQGAANAALQYIVLMLQYTNWCLSYKNCPTIAPWPRTPCWRPLQPKNFHWWCCAPCQLYPRQNIARPPTPSARTNLLVG